MLRFAALCLPLFLSTITAQAGDFGSIDKIEEVFNLAARSAQHDTRLVKLGCSKDPPPSCNYGTGSNVLIMSFAIGGDGSRANQVLIAFNKHSRSKEDYIETVWISMFIWAPFTSRAERLALIRKLSDSFETGEMTKGELRGVIYEQKRMPEIGLVLMMTKAD